MFVWVPGGDERTPASGSAHLAPILNIESHTATQVARVRLRGQNPSIGIGGPRQWLPQVRQGRSGGNARAHQGIFDDGLWDTLEGNESGGLKAGDSLHRRVGGVSTVRLRRKAEAEEARARRRPGIRLSRVRIFAEGSK